MNETELLAILARGEDSRHPFKENISNVDSLTAEWVAFSNSGGGLLIVGANDAGEVVGLTTADIGRLNQLLSNAASQSVRPSVHPSDFAQLPDGAGPAHGDPNARRFEPALYR